MRPPEQEPRDWLVAGAASVVLHTVLLALGNVSLDAEAERTGTGVGPLGNLEVIALTPMEAERLLARRGRPRPALLVEAGGAGTSTPEGSKLEPARPPGPRGKGVGAGPSAPPLLEGTGGEGAGPRPAPLLEGALAAPSALPATPTPEAGAPADATRGAIDRQATNEGPDEPGGADATGSDGRGPADAGASDGAAASGVDANLLDRLTLFRPVPEYPADLARKDRARGIRRRTAVFEITIDGAGKVSSVTLVDSCGLARLDRLAERAARRWLFDVQALRDRGLDGEPLTLELHAYPPD